MKYILYNEVKWHSPFFYMAFAFNKDTRLLHKHMPWKQDKSWTKKHIYYFRSWICEVMQYILYEVKPHHFFLHILCFKRKDSTSGKWWWCCSLVSLMFHLDGRAYCIMQPCLFSKVSFTSTLQTLFFALLDVFNQLMRSLINQGIVSFGHIGTNPFFKEDHIHFT